MLYFLSNLSTPNLKNCEDFSIWLSAEKALMQLISSYTDASDDVISAFEG